MGIFAIFKESIKVFLTDSKDLVISFIILSIFQSLFVFILISIFGDPTYEFNFVLSKTPLEEGVSDLFSYNLIQHFVSYLVLGANSLALLDLVRGWDYSIHTVIEKFKENYPTIIILSLILALLNSILGKIPVIGSLLGLILTLGFSYVFFLIEDGNIEYTIDYFKTSYRLSQGHKLYIFILETLYVILPYIIIIVTSIVLLPGIILTFGLLGLVIAFLWLLLSAFFHLLSTLGLTIYYHNNGFKKLSNLF